MTRFLVFQDGKPARDVDLSGAHFVGTDGVPVRADIDLRDGAIRCRKRTEGPAGLVLLWPIEGVGRFILETSRLPERSEPYNLHVELARGRLMRIDQKREDWGLYDCEGTEELIADLDQARDSFIEAVKADDPAVAASLADQALKQAVLASEKMTMFHADIFLGRRKQSGGFGRRMFGCRIDLGSTSDAYRDAIPPMFDFVTVPVPWRQVEPKEQEFNWQPVDAWVEWLTKKNVPIKMSPLVSFHERHIPDWLYIWENDFETVRDLVYEHVRRVVERYGTYVVAWDVISGIHADNTFNFSFEQLMELTRLASALTKQLAPRATTIIELVSPWGEYYARNQRTIPPMLYAEMAVQSGISFDAFGLPMIFGVGTDGMYVRDLFQISSMIDRFGNLGKAIHVTAAGAPSATGPDKDDESGGTLLAEAGGQWHGEWSGDLQAEWLRSFYRTAMSKPFIESIAWRDLADAGKHGVPHGGLLGRDFKPKPAVETLRSLRQEFTGSATPAPARRTRPPAPPG